MDRWGYGTITKGENVIIEYNYCENDGWSFMNRGPERELHLTIKTKISPGELERLIQDDNSSAAMVLRQMIEKGEVNKGHYQIEEKNNSYDIKDLIKLF